LEEIDFSGRTPDKSVQLVFFKMNGHSFAVDVLEVMGIEKLEHMVTRVPKAAPFVEGVFNLRGEIIPLVDLRIRFGFDITEKNEASRIVILEHRSNPVGMLVDEVPQVQRLSENDIDPADEAVFNIDPWFMRGIIREGQRTTVLLNIDHALTPQEPEESAQGLPEAEV
jgi:purine-binding chemotaxis protein CheW